MSKPRYPALSLALTTLLFILSSLPAHAEGPVEGIHYERLTPAQPSNAPEGKIEVVEMFWYGCPHCYHFEPYVKAWLKQKADNIVFTPMPALLSPRWESHARFYYAAKALGVADKLHDALFIALHEKKQRLYKAEDLFDFAASKGVDREKFAEAYKSFAVSTKIQRAKKYGQAIGLDGVPAIVIDGKFKTSASHAGSFEGMVYLMNNLPKQIETEQQAESEKKE